MIESLTGVEATMREILRKEGELRIQNSDQLLLSLDLEATGIVGHGSVYEIGAVSPFGETFRTRLQPFSQDRIERMYQFVKQHGFDEEAIKTAPHFAEAITNLRDWVLYLQNRYQKVKSVAVVGNKDFDNAFLELHFFKAQLDNPIDIAAFDLKSLAMGLSKDWNWFDTYIGSDERERHIPRIALPDTRFDHTALGDAKFQHYVHCILAGLYGRMRFGEDIRQFLSIR